MINLALIPQTKAEPYPYNADQEAWLKELETGNKAQGRGWLQIDGRYCCLGVACSVLGAEATQGLGGTMLFQAGNSTEDKNLPLPLVYRLRMRGRSGNFANTVRIKGTEYNTLTAMNDDWHVSAAKGAESMWSDASFTFKDIAAYIRHDPWNVFLGPDEVNPDGVPLS